MKVMSTKEEWLYRLVIDNIRVKPRPDGEYYIDILLSGIPKDKYDTTLVLKTIGNVQNIASEFLDDMDFGPDPDFEEIQNTLQTKLKEHFFEE